MQGSACSEYEDAIEAIQCHNAGEDDMGDVQWKCEADLPSSVKLGHVEVSCEGFRDRDDSLKLAGSCGLEYGLVWAARCAPTSCTPLLPTAPARGSKHVSRHP